MATPRIVFVTGGNNGLGYETVKALFKSPRIYNILVGSRSVEKGTLSINTLKNEIPESKSTLELVQLDLTSDDSIEKASEQIKAKYGKLDTLINNAGTHSPLPNLQIPPQKKKSNSSKEYPSTPSSSPPKSPYANASQPPTTQT